MYVKPECGKTRDEIVAYLEKHNIQTRNLFAGNILRHPCFEIYEKNIDYRVVGSMENTDNTMHNAFWIGVYPGMTNEMLDEMIMRIKQIVSD